jgi:hypothetical protein
MLAKLWRALGWGQAPAVVVRAPVDQKGWEPTMPTSVPAVRAPDPPPTPRLTSVVLTLLPPPLPPPLQLPSGRPRAGQRSPDVPLPSMPGWLSPAGEFFPTYGQGRVALVDPEGRAITGREYEVELERQQYVKLMINAYTARWCPPRGWGVTREQWAYMVDWYTGRHQALPDWLTEQV